MTTDHVEKSFEARRKLEYLACELRGIARAFSTVGNEQMATQLSAIADDVVEQANIAHAAYIEMGNQMHVAQWQASANMVNAALAIASQKGSPK